MPEIHVAFALHDSKGDYWPNLAAALTSVCQYSSRKMIIHLLHDETLGEEALSVFRRIVSFHDQRLALHPVDLVVLLEGLDFGQFSVGAAFRLALPKILSHLAWLVYLDSDVIFNSFDVVNFEEWLCSQSSEMPIAAVHDDLFSASPSQCRELEMLSISASEYVNSGVLLIRPPLVTENLVAELLDFVKQFPSAYHKDQDLLNSLFRGRLGRLPSRFNYQVNIVHGRLFLPSSELEGKILHYTGKIKPLSGMLAPGHLPFWRHSQFVPNISRFFPDQISYLQKLNNDESRARLIPPVAPNRPST